MTKSVAKKPSLCHYLLTVSSWPCSWIIAYYFLPFLQLHPADSLCLCTQAWSLPAPPPVQHQDGCRGCYRGLLVAARSQTLHYFKYYDDDCNVPHRSSVFAQSAFSYKAIKVWNMLPPNLKNISDYNSFRTGAKKWLLSGQSCQHWSVGTLRGWFCPDSIELR